MEPINWLALDTFEDYGVVLKQILSAAETADVTERSSLIDLLKRFVKETPPEASRLDDIASDLSTDLLLQNLDVRLAAIGRRNERLNELIPGLEAITANANADAATIQFKPIIKQLDNAKKAIEAVKELAVQLNADDATKTAKLNAIIKAIGELSGIFKPAGS